MFNLVYLVIFAGCALSSRTPVCPNKIYCHGELLHAVQTLSIFGESKAFVDMMMKQSPKDTLNMFEEMIKEGKTRDETAVREFVMAAFESHGDEFVNWDPVDWTSDPEFVKTIKNPELRKWASFLNELWMLLGRKMSDDVRLNQDRYSLIYLPNPVVVPGGRFTEMYYWDTYWIVKGLLLSEMNLTVKGILKNLVLLVERFGFVPNGGRVYQTSRSQPPLLIPMFKTYIDVTSDHSFLAENINSLEKEFQFWVANRTVSITLGNTTYLMFRYAENSLGPRPEAYKEDIQLASHFQSPEEKEEFYSHLKSAAEAGNDFSSRWFIKDGQNIGSLIDIKTKLIIPVDLNALMFRNAIILSSFYYKLNAPGKGIFYKNTAARIKKSVQDIFWDEESGMWYDYDSENKLLRKYFYGSNFVPLWTECYNKSQKTHVVNKVISYIKKKNLFYPGGIPASLYPTGHQWDFPNAWPPHQAMIIEGLELTKVEKAQSLALKLATKWVLSNFMAFNESLSMYEKYDARGIGLPGYGGEYIIQTGFGMTNGVALELLAKYGYHIKSAAIPFHSFNKSYITVIFMFIRTLSLIQ